ncbi:MAG: MotA/TolQ/ExbB proton channel family protein [Chlamydiia bacterium]|nr:MotA/TolQ/ExbB proton channel family protein [Chlamydiia bacterium]
MVCIPHAVGSITSEIFTRYLLDWNMIFLIIALSSLVAVTIFIERLIFLKKSEIDTNQFILILRKVIEEGNIVEAIRICEETGGSVANIIRSGLVRHDRKRNEIEHGMEISGLSEIAKLEKNARILSIIAHITPLIGLLGTVLGFIQAFGEMRQTGLMDISTTRVGEAMEYALFTTAAGLVVAIPCVVGYNYLVSRIKGMVLEMQTTSSEIVDLLTYK